MVPLGFAQAQPGVGLGPSECQVTQPKNHTADQALPDESPTTGLGLSLMLISKQAFVSWGCGKVCLHPNEGPIFFKGL